MSTLTIQTRDPKHQAVKLRKQGLLPMALLARDHTTTLVQSTEEELKKAMRGADGLGRVDVETADGRKLKAVVKKVDRDILTTHIIHAVLQEVGEDDTVTLDVAVVPHGTPEAVTEGLATLQHQTDTIKIRGKMSSMPQHLEVDISHLGIGEHVAASEIALPEGITLISSPDAMLFSVNVLRAAIEEEAPVVATASPESTEGE